MDLQKAQPGVPAGVLATSENWGGLQKSLLIALGHQRITISLPAY